MGWEGIHGNRNVETLFPSILTDRLDTICTTTQHNTITTTISQSIAESSMFLSSNQYRVCYVLLPCLSWRDGWSVCLLRAGTKLQIRILPS